MRQIPATPPACPDQNAPEKGVYIHTDGTRWRIADPRPGAVCFIRSRNKAVVTLVKEDKTHG